MAATLESIQRDDLAMAIAQALATANGEAVRRGVDLDRSLVTISEETPPPGRVWRIHYGSRDYQNRRGGDLMVFVDEQSSAVQRVVRGQ